MTQAPDSTKCFTILSRLVLQENNAFPGVRIGNSDSFEETSELIASLQPPDWKELHSLAGTHHVILRALPRLLSFPVGNEYEWIQTAVETEQARIDRALSWLAPICQELQNAGTVVVIKSLDHWPDLGSDLDLYTDADAPRVVAIMRNRFHAQLETQSWGDRLANKWNFQVPGLPELVEVHVQRLGQTGEQRLIGAALVSRSPEVQFGSHAFRVPSREDRIIVSTLQRMFRHFYIRLCDVLDVAKSVEQGEIDYDYLSSLARSTGLWPGVATYLKIISQYVRQFRGEGIALPSFVLAAARFGNEKVRFAKRFLRIPIVPQSASLYATELKELISNGEFQNTLRLGLLPLLATAAAVEFRITGTDKGIW